MSDPIHETPESADDDTCSKTPSLREETESTRHVPETPFFTYCDARLSLVDFQAWTDIPIQNSMAAGAVSRYLETDHPVHGLFDADLFLHDLSKGQHNFCSPTLVNAVLGWACVSRSSVDICSGYR